MSKLPFVVIASLALLPIGVRYTVAPALEDSQAAVSRAVVKISKSYTEGVGDAVSASVDGVESGAKSAAKWSEKTFRKYFSIAGVRVSGNSVIERQELLDALADVPGVWLWDLKTEEVEHRVAGNPWVEGITIERSGVPVWLEVSVREKKPRAVVELSESSWIVSDNGELIQELNNLRNVDFIEETMELPRLSGFDELKSDGNFSFAASFRYTVDFLNRIEQAGGLPFAVERFELRDSGTIVAVPEAGKELPKVFFAMVDTQDSLSELLTRLRLVLDDLKSRGETAQELDMRFKNQAIVRS